MLRNGSRQLSLLDPPTWGGARRGAGRKPVRRKAGSRSRVPHRVRPEHKWRYPVHITLRAHKGLPLFRRERVYRILKGVIAGAHRDDFRVTHYSVQGDHLHLLIETNDKASLSSRIRSLVIRMALRLNKRLDRKGAVWGDRYHRRDLKSIREVRNALVYVLFNFKKHRGYARDAELVDPFSSALWTSGWHPRHRPRRIASDEAPPVEPPETWLLGIGWQRYGLLRANEGPLSS